MITEKRKIHSMNSRIWRMVIGILLLFLISITIINSVNLKKSKEDFLFNQLKEAAQDKKRFQRSDKEITYINHFLITKSGDDYGILADSKTASRYMDKGNRSHILEAIGKKVIEEKINGSYSLGKITLGNQLHYYYAEYGDDSEGIMVFIASTEVEPLISLSFIIAFMITLIISFIVTKIISNKIVKPIYDLETFAEDIANHKWDVTPPISDTAEIQELSDSLDHMREALKTRDDWEREFLQSSSHSLKTPVMVIKGYSQAMIDGLLVDSPESPAEVIRREAENLERRVSQLLKLYTYAHALENEGKQDSIRIDRLLNSLIRRFQIIKPNLRWDVNITPVEVEGNSEALLTAFENIIENQIRYAKSVISISIKKETMYSISSIVIKIANDGPHFNQEDPMCLFHRYKKDESGQWGLGLAIVKQIIEAHNGNVIADNTEEGVEFVVTLQE